MISFQVVNERHEEIKIVVGGNGAVDSKISVESPKPDVDLEVQQNSTLGCDLHFLNAFELTNFFSFLAGFPKPT